MPPFIRKCVFIHADKTHFHTKSCAVGLALKKRDNIIRKWPVAECSSSENRFLLTLKVASSIETFTIL